MREENCQKYPSMRDKIGKKTSLIEGYFAMMPNPMMP